MTTLLNVATVVFLVLAVLVALGHWGSVIESALNTRRGLKNSFSMFPGFPQIFVGLAGLSQYLGGTMSIPIAVFLGVALCDFSL